MWGTKVMANMIRLSCAFGALLLPQLHSHAQDTGTISVHYDINATRQTIRNFAASDAWACQFVGNWPNAKKNAIADWLFSMDTFADGSPRGIGLSMWRYNFGAGSAAQGDSSGIRDEWRRAASFTDNDLESTNRIKAQNWFIEAAQKRGVQQFLGFFNSPPVTITVNGKSFAGKGQCNIDSNRYTTFAQVAVKAIQQVKRSTGIAFDYVSPVNEPQWDWSDGGQEGCPYNNAQISAVVKHYQGEWLKNKMTAKILITESGHHKYLFGESDKPGKDNQISDFFSSYSVNYVGNWPGIVRAIASHSYFTTSPGKDAIALRNRIRDSIARISNLEYWQSEYCILGDNAGEINGNRRDTGMRTALYVAKVLHYDLAEANAAAWHWWLAVSPYNYKDGLVYIDKNKTNGNYYDSKLLWAVGNYSRFVRPGMQRIDVKLPSQQIYVSGFKDANKVVLVFVNPTTSRQSIKLKEGNKNIVTYTTNKTDNLKKRSVPVDQLWLPAESVVTVIVNNGK
jgi:hypothetical protein